MGHGEGAAGWGEEVELGFGGHCGGIALENEIIITSAR